MRKLSRTKIKSRSRNKSNPILAETIASAVKHPNWQTIAKKLSGPTRQHTSLNLFQIEKETTAGDTVLVLGKVLSNGELTKKIRIIALSISEKAMEKLALTKSEFSSILEEIKKNPKKEGVKQL